MLGIEDCQEVETTKTVSRTHNGRSFVVKNPKYREIGVILVDGCVINDESRRVDWMVRLPLNKKLKDGTDCFKLIELKGSNVMHAFTQMRQTMVHAAIAPHRKLVNEGFIVSQLNPALQSIAQNEQVKFLNEFGVIVRVVKAAEIDASPV
jgi:hypothetical protein